MNHIAKLIMAASLAAGMTATAQTDLDGSDLIVTGGGPWNTSYQNSNRYTQSVVAIYNLANGTRYDYTGSFIGNLFIDITHNGYANNENRFTFSNAENNIAGGVAMHNGILFVSNDNQLVSFTGGITLDNAVFMAYGECDFGVTLREGSFGGMRASGGNLVLNQKVTGKGDLVIVTDGNSVTLNGTNNYAGVTSIGTVKGRTNGKAHLILGADNTLPSTTVVEIGKSQNATYNYTGATTATLDLNGTTQTISGLHGAGKATIANGTAAPANLTIDLADGASYDYSGTIAGNSAANPINLTVAGAGNQTLSGNIADSSLSKTGSGTLTLGGNTVSLTTLTVTGGTLAIAPNTVSTVGGKFLGVSCVVATNGNGGEMTFVLAGPGDGDGVADVAVYADETGAGAPVWTTNGVALAEGAAEFTVSPVGGVTPGQGQHVFATYYSNSRNARTIVAKKVMDAPPPSVSNVASASSDPFRMDTREGEIASSGSETLTYSALWHGDTNSIVTISQDGTALADATVLDGEGEYAWSVPYDGTYVLTHATSGTNVVETATFVVTGLTQPFATNDILLADCEVVYDGEGHGIGVGTNAIDGLRLRYCTAPAGSEIENGEWRTDNSPPLFTNVCEMTVWVEASAPGFFTETNSATVKITPLDLSGATIEPIGPQYYEGESLTPPVTVQVGGLRPAAGTDYDINYTNNAALGTATVTLTGKGNYTNEVSTTFQILPARLELTVTADKWGAVAVETNGVEMATVGPNATTNLVVAYGAEVTATAVPDAGFAVDGDADSVSFPSFTNAAEAAFAFLPRPEPSIRWTFSRTVGRHFAQIAMTNHAGYAEALEGLAYVFADRTNAAGTVYAQLWDAAAKAPQGVLLASGGAEQRGVALDAAAFGGLAEGARAVWGVADATLADAAGAVPASERQIGMYVRNRVIPASGNEAAGEVESFVGYLTWTSNGTRYFQPLVEGAAPGAAATEAAASASATGTAVPPTTYAVVFKANGGTGSMADQTISCGKTANLSANAFTRKGYVFLGWAKTAKGAVAYKDKAGVKDLAAAGARATLHAKWAKETYSVKFCKNGGTGTMKVQKLAYGTSKKLLANKFKRDGYVFKGWATSAAKARKGKVAYSNKQKVKNLTKAGKTVKLYAVWGKK